MCGRYSIALSSDEFEQFSSLRVPYDFSWRTRYNAAPSQELPVLMLKDDRPKLRLAKWGFHPSWLKEAGDVPPPINARGESVETKPYFKNAFKTSRCLVPASSFFEWSSGKKVAGKRTPYLVELEGQSAFYFAGVFENDTFAIVTTAANERLARLHHRMPVMIESRESADLWLKGSPEEAKALIHAVDSEKVKLTEVSTRVNQASNDSKEVLEPSGQVSLFPGL